MQRSGVPNALHPCAGMVERGLCTFRTCGIVPYLLCTYTLVCMTYLVNIAGLPVVFTLNNLFSSLWLVVCASPLTALEREGNFTTCILLQYHFHNTYMCRWDFSYRYTDIEQQYAQITISLSPSSVSSFCMWYHILFSWPNPKSTITLHFLRMYMNLL